MNQTIKGNEANPTLAKNRTSWIGFTLNLEKNIDLPIPLKTKQQVDEEEVLFVRIIKKKAWESTSTLRRKVIENNYEKEIQQLSTGKGIQRRT